MSDNIDILKVKIRKVEKEDLRAVSEIAVTGWQTAYRGIIDDKFLDNMSIEENYPSRVFYEKLGGIYCGENVIERGNKEYKEVGYLYDLKNINPID